MRVLLVADFYPPAPGGLEAHVQRLARALLAHGHDVVVAASGRPCGETTGPDGVRVATWRPAVARVPGLLADASTAYHPPWPDRAVTRVLRTVIDEFEPDVVHAHGWSAFSAAQARSGLPLVVTLHDYGLRCPKKTLLRRGRECGPGRGVRCVNCSGEGQGALKRSALAGALAMTANRLPAGVSRFLAVSSHVAARHLEAGLAASSIEVIPNFLDLPATLPSAPHEPAEVLFVGPDSVHKGRAVLVEAFRALGPSPATLVVVGDGKRGPVRGVEWAGRLQGDALWERYRRASLVVVPSVWPEPCPTVALEAMAWGRPLVGSRIGGLPDLVEHERTGLLVEPNDSAALVDALRRLLQDPVLRARLGQGARRKAGDFSTASVVPRIEAVYEAVLDTVTA